MAHDKDKISNPFMIGERIIPEYFCDRKEESKKLSSLVKSGNNVLLVSPRRMGKTSLIDYCFQSPELQRSYLCIYIDILSTTSLREFILMLGRQVYASLQSKGAKILTKFAAAMKSISGCFGFDPTTSLPTFNLQLGDIVTPVYTLEEIFTFLSSAEKKCLIAIDEFQQITNYPEKNIEALLRTYIQQVSDIRFIFAGSERTILRQMFLSTSRPFYLSAAVIELMPIEKSVYAAFARKMFTDFGKKIECSTVDAVYDLFSGHTFYLQRTLNCAFSMVERGEICSIQTVRQAVIQLMRGNATLYSEILANTPLNHKQLLIAIAVSGAARNISSAAFITSHRLTSASSVQNSTKQLLKAELITRSETVPKADSAAETTYTITDPLLGIWLKATYGPAPYYLLGVAL